MIESGDLSHDVPMISLKVMKRTSQIYAILISHYIFIGDTYTIIVSLLYHDYHYLTLLNTTRHYFTLLTSNTCCHYFTFLDKTRSGGS